MRLVVVIVCVDCHRQVEVRVEGETFDIAAVEHDCEAVKAFTVTRSDDAQLRIAA